MGSGSKPGEELFIKSKVTMNNLLAESGKTGRNFLLDAVKR